MKILITGGTGYLGSNLIKAFLRSGHQILCIKVKDAHMHYLGDVKSKITFLDTCDIYYETKIKDFMPDSVVHTAGQYERHGIKYADLFSANLSFPFKLIDLCSHIGVRKWINTSTALTGDLNSYSLSKGQFSEWGRLFSKKGINFVDVKLEHFYGPNAPKTNFISWVLDKLMNNDEIDLTLGTQRRDFIYVDDVVAGFELLLNTDVKGYEIVPLGTGEDPTIREVVEFLHQISKSNSNLNFGKIPMRDNEPDSVADIEKMTEHGFTCKHSWKTGLKEIVEMIF